MKVLLVIFFFALGLQNIYAQLTQSNTYCNPINLDYTKMPLTKMASPQKPKF